MTGGWQIAPAQEPLAEEVARLERLLADLEMDTATLESDLARFEAEYIRRLGPFLAELEDLGARIAELLAEQHPEDEQARARADARRASADDMAQEAEAAAEREETLPEPPVPAEPELTALWREAVKTFHPDLGPPGEVQVRQEYTAQANRAYAERNAGKLKDLLDRWHLGHASDKPTGEILERRIERLQRAVTMARAKREQIEDGDLFGLWRVFQETDQEDRSFFEQQIDSVKAEIMDAQNRLRDLLGDAVR
jgi:hypothetical protein